MTISRRQFVSASSLSVAALGLARLPVLGQAGAQAPAAPAPPVTKFEEIRRGVGFFTGNGGTIGYLVNNDGAIAIDSQFMPTAEICIAGLKQRAPKGIELLVNTHHHGDHTSGNPAFRPVVKRILAHENCVAWQRKVAEQAAANSTRRRRAGAGRRPCMPTRRSRTPGRSTSAARPCTSATSGPAIRAVTR